MKKLGDILIESGLLTPEKLEEALGEQQKRKGKKLGDILVDKGILTDIQIMKALEYQSRIPYVELSDIQIDAEAPGLVSEEMAKKHVLIPIAIENNQIVLVMNDPLDFIAIDEIRYMTGKEVSPRISTRKQIMDAIDANYGKEKAQKAVQQLEKEFDVEEIVRITEQITDEVANAPVVKLVNSIIEHAIRINASDIHIEPHETKMRVRLRLDGVLQEVMTAPKNAHAAVITRIKIIGGMDIAEKRIPQDGRVETTIAGRQDEENLLWYYDRNTVGMLAEKRTERAALNKPLQPVISSREAMLDDTVNNIVSLSLDDVNLLYSHDFIQRVYTDKQSRPT